MGENKFVLTNQRSIILDYIKDNHTHPTVDEMFNHVKRKLPRISKKTVYSNLKFLVENDLISEVNVKGVLRYEPKIDPHHHLFCKSCGKIIDFESDKLLDYSMGLAKGIKDFHVYSTETNFYGICKRCKGLRDGKV